MDSFVRPPTFTPRSSATSACITIILADAGRDPRRAGRRPVAGSAP